MSTSFSTSLIQYRKLFSTPEEAKELFDKFDKYYKESYDETFERQLMIEKHAKMMCDELIDELCKWNITKKPVFAQFCVTIKYEDFIQDKLVLYQ